MKAQDLRTISDHIADLPEPQHILSNIRRQVLDRRRIIRVHGQLKLTKSGHHATKAYLLRDLALEDGARRWLEERTSFDEVMARYRAYDPSLASEDWPQHYAVSVLAGMGSICSGANIFMFFPEVVGLPAESDADCFGFEFIDVWANIFRRTIFPCWAQTFDLESQMEVIPSLACGLERTIYLAAVFHEIGHRVGPFKVSPAKAPWLNVSTFHLDVLGELLTDTLLVLHLPEFPEIAHFVFAQRLFWFGRRGFAADPTCGSLNEDNDAWISAMLWNRALAEGVVERAETGYRFRADRLIPFFRGVRDTLDELGRELEVWPDEEGAQNAAVRAWMSREVERDARGSFVFSPEQRRLFLACQKIEETPHFSPLLGFSI